MSKTIQISRADKNSPNPFQRGLITFTTKHMKTDATDDSFDNDYDYINDTFNRTGMT